MEQLEAPMAMCGRPPRCKEKMEDQQLGQVRSCVRPRTMRYASPGAMMNSTDRVPITSPHILCRGHLGSSQSRLDRIAITSHFSLARGICCIGDEERAAGWVRPLRWQGSCRPWTVLPEGWCREHRTYLFKALRS